METLKTFQKRTGIGIEISLWNRFEKISERNLDNKPGMHMETDRKELEVGKSSSSGPGGNPSRCQLRKKFQCIVHYNSWSQGINRIPFSLFEFSNVPGHAGFANFSWRISPKNLIRSFLSKLFFEMIWQSSQWFRLLIFLRLSGLPSQTWLCIGSLRNNSRSPIIPSNISIRLPWI